MNHELIMLRKKAHLSISAICEFVQCPRKYYLHYEAKVAPAFRPAALVFGSAWHATIAEWLTLPVEDAQPERLRQHLRDGLVAGLNDDGANVLFDDADDDQQILIDKAISMLDAFLASVARPEKTFAVEQTFSLELVHPQTGEALPVPLIGAIDAVVLSEGRVCIWELKTAAKKWSAQIEHDFQVTAYGMVGRQLGYDGARLELLIVTKTAKPAVQRETVVRHRADEDEFVDLAIGVHRAVKAGVAHRTRSWACATCAYPWACRA